ncbi:NAD-dependent deacylase [candidate division CSSED10-310 bacterium]|uniref:protein acetyllysine N-acetyltransferase n=1 Tax=candidate division CSSED10-310 bacterium TaxID=2855610 RepID=A0ABV6YUD5_UNCC1
MAEIQIKHYNKIVFFTGAGLSAESGIPTYRGKGGVWQEYNYEDFACQRAFDKDPQKVWEFHNKRREFINGCQPNEGHRIIAAVEQTKPQTMVITQNIDGMHQRAGSKKVIELHGSLWRVRCDREGTISENTDIPLKSMKCDCGEYLRPDIVWFEDPLDQQKIQQAVEAIFQSDLFVSIGTSGVVFPAAQLPAVAIQNSVPTVEINIESTPLSQLYQYRLQGPASEMLKQLCSDSD